MTTPREPPSAARIALIRAIVGEFAKQKTVGKWAGGCLYVGLDLLAALDYCRETLEAIAVMQVGDYADDAIEKARHCIERLFWREPQ